MIFKLLLSYHFCVHCVCALGDNDPEHIMNAFSPFLSFVLIEQVKLAYNHKANNGVTSWGRERGKIDDRL